MNLKPLLGIAALAICGSAAAQITFYEHKDFRGRAYTADRPVMNFKSVGFNDQASSIVVDRGRWEVCEDARFQGKCVLLRRGNYASLEDIGLQNNISSVRPADDGRPGRDVPPPPVAAYEWRQRPGERLIEVPVTSVRAVMGPPEQRCWVERQQVEERNTNVPGAVIGGVLGGILGHQIGRGTGRDVATVGGAVGGAVIGGNVNSRGTDTRDVQRCSTAAPSGPPQFWDVTYNYRGQEHRVQTSAPPGRTITVNAGNGEPRG